MTEFQEDLLIALVSAFVGGSIATFLFNDKIRPYISSRKMILERLKANKTLASIEEKRIEKNALERLNQWLTENKSTNESKKGIMALGYFKLPNDATETTTACPSSDKYMFFDSKVFIEKSGPITETDEVVKSFNDFLEKTDDDNISKKLFKIIGEFPDLTIWIRLPNYEMTSRENFSDLQKRLSSISSSFFPKSNTVLETFIPQTLFPQKEYLENMKDQKHTTFLYEIGARTYLKDLAIKTFLGRNIIGKLDFEKNRRIPAHLIKSRIDQGGGDFDNTLIQITGKPGSGKTEYLDYIIKNKIPKERPTLVVVFNSHHPLLDIENYKAKYFAFVEWILNMVNLSALFDLSDDHLDEIRPILLRLLEEKKVRLTIVLDSMEYSEKLYHDITKFLSSDKISNIQFIMAGRFLPDQAVKVPSVTKINTSLWTYEESLQIIEHWNGDSTSIINKPWLKSNKQLSIYLLRIIASTKKDIKPNELVKREISSILDPVLNGFEKVKTSPVHLVKRIREIVKTDFNKADIESLINQEKELNIIHTFGHITWHRLYDDNLDQFNEGIQTDIIPEKIINWSKNLIPDIETAKQFVTACEKSGILKNSNLSDKLIQDGTAAIVLQENEIREYMIESASRNPDQKRLNELEGAIHRLISALAEKNSLEIFKLSFRIEELLVVLDSIIKSNREKDVLNEILTDDYILFLKVNPENLARLTYSLIKSFRDNKLEEKDKTKVAMCISKIIQLDDKSSAHFDTLKGESQDREMILNVLSLDPKNEERLDFLASATIEEHITFFRYCCFNWTYEYGSELLTELLFLANKSPNNVKLLVEHYLNWINEQDLKNVVSVIDLAFNLITEKEDEEKEVLRLVIVAVFNTLYDNRTTNNLKHDYHFNYQLDKWKATLKRYTLNETIKTSELIKLIAFGYDEKLWDRNADYKLIIDKKHNKIYGIPYSQRKKEGLRNVFEQFTNTDHFDLPSGQLLKLVYKKSDKRELVSDAITGKGRKYVPFPEIFAAEHKYFQNNEVHSMTRKDLEEKKLYGWRAVFIL